MNTPCFCVACLAVANVTVTVCPPAPAAGAVTTQPTRRTTAPVPRYDRPTGLWTVAPSMALSLDEETGRITETH
jgi:hypothetical protein